MIYIPMKVRHEVKALAAGRIFEFYITDDIKPDGERFNWDTYSWEAVESTTCQRYFVENTKDAQAGDTINLYINSWGGSVKEALGIYNVLRRCGATVVAYIDGVAASAASVIAMAADKVIMPRNTAMMVHNAAWGVYGNSKELRKSADDLDIINGAMLQSYIVKAGDKLPAEKLEELTDGETLNPSRMAFANCGSWTVENGLFCCCPVYATGSARSANAAILTLSKPDTPFKCLFGFRKWTL